MAVKDLKNSVTEFSSSAGQYSGTAPLVFEITLFLPPVLDSSPASIPRNSSFWQALASENTSSQVSIM